jgi:hypothetical protein
MSTLPSFKQKPKCLGTEIKLHALKGIGFFQLTTIPVSKHCVLAGTKNQFHTPDKLQYKPSFGLATFRISLVHVSQKQERKHKIVKRLQAKNSFLSLKMRTKL